MFECSSVVLCRSSPLYLQQSFSIKCDRVNNLCVVFEDHVFSLVFTQYESLTNWFFHILTSILFPIKGIFIANIVSYETQPVSVLGVVYEPTTWVIALSWAIVFSSPIFIPILMIYQLLKAKGTFLEVSNTFWILKHCSQFN